MKWLKDKLKKFGRCLLWYRIDDIVLVLFVSVAMLVLAIKFGW